MSNGRFERGTALNRMPRCPSRQAEIRVQRSDASQENTTGESGMGDACGSPTRSAYETDRYGQPIESRRGGREEPKASGMDLRTRPSQSGANEEMRNTTGVLSPLSGLLPLRSGNPRLKPWATLCRLSEAVAPRTADGPPCAAWTKNNTCLRQFRHWPWSA